MLCCEILPKLIIKITVFIIVNFEQILHLFLVFLIVDFKQINVCWVNDSNFYFFILNFYVPFLENALFYIALIKDFSLSACSLCNYLTTLHVFLMFNRHDGFNQSKVIIFAYS